MRKILNLTGQTFGRLTVIGPDPNKKRYWLCRCVCGNTLSTFSGNLTRGLTKSCGCLNKELASERNLMDLTGKKFGRLTVIERSPDNSKNGQPKWICKCDCGKITTVGGWNLRSGQTRSCGCLSKEVSGERIKELHKKFPNHVEYNSPEELTLARVRNSMMQRCYNPNNKSHYRYGERGITICDEWRNSTREFIDWALSHGYAPGLTIDRIDNDGPYCPENCRWTTKVVQANNRSSNMFLTVDGVSHTLADWARLCNISYRILWHMPYEDAAEMIRRFGIYSGQS